MGMNKTDRIFRKIFMGLMTLALMLVFILSSHIFFAVPLDSKMLWTGSLLTYLVINLIIDICGIANKLIVLLVSIVILGIFFNTIINWPLGHSLMTGMVIMIVSGLLYFTFLH